ncbi:MAG TPA: hypothetical protein VHC96_18425 [Puia sp.]|jgi:hypothetical protein|nr:hypothetical protein [Puia sp.]
MKKSILRSNLFRLAVIVLIATAASFTTSSASAQVYVTVRPTWAPVARPVAPSPAHVWIDEDWEYRGGRYVAVGGHWVTPPHRGWIWVPGRWVHTRRGWQWMRGHWRKR